MCVFQIWPERCLLLGLLLFLSPPHLMAQSQTGTLRGKVTDQFEGLLIGADVKVTDMGGVIRTAKTNDEGLFVVSGLPPGKYTVQVMAENFVPYENKEVSINPGRSIILNLKLGVTIERQEVTISEDKQINTSPDNNASGIVLREAEIEMLPDDPNLLVAYLQALAGPGVGPNGIQIIVDGFTGNRLPPKSSIREVRINRNPFSSEYERMGSGRVEISTRAGTDRFRGQGFINFNDESLNARDPFASNRAPYQNRHFGGNLGGPLIVKKSAFFLSFNRQELDENAIINATILNPALSPTPFSQAVLTPQRSTSFSPRFDYQVNPNNTLIGRFGYSQSSFRGAGVGGFSLLSRAYNLADEEKVVQFTETAILSSKLINESRFQLIRRNRSQRGDNTTPGIIVQEAFTGGGAQVGLGSSDENRIEFANFSTMSLGNHTLRTGIRLRNINLREVSPQNFGGAFLFTSLDQFSQTLRGVPGSRPEQFTISGGNPETEVSQFDFGAFAQEDWRMRPNFTLSFGLRYEVQTNIHSPLNFAPRVAFAWAPKAAGTSQPKTVIRGGFGVFYDRFNENYTLQANRFEGFRQQRYIVTDPRVLDQFPVAPSVASLAAFALPQSKIIVADDLQTPYAMHSSVSLERQLPNSFTLSVTFINSRMLHALRSLNINAPFPDSGLRPLGNGDNVFAFESSGLAKQNQLIVSINRFGKRFVLFGSYGLNRVRSDTDGASTFPANTYDLRGEWGPSSLDIRQFLFMGGGVTLPKGLRLNAHLTIRSGVPYNITTGRDTNGDSLFNERPAFATNLTKPGIIITPLGAFDPNPAPGDTIIPRNFGRGPVFILPDIVLEKTFRFGHAPGSRAAVAPPPGNAQANRGAPSSNGPRVETYNLSFTVVCSNFINHVNKGIPIGNLSSPFFGMSNSSAGGFGFGGARIDFGSNPGTSSRRITLMVRLSF